MRVVARRVFLGVAAAVLIGSCQRGSAARDATVPPPTEPRSLDTPSARDVPTFLRAGATGPSNDEACGLARRELLGQLLGDPRWADLISTDVLQTHLGESATALERDADGVAQCTIGLDESQAAATLLDLEVTPPIVEAPPGWKDTIYAFVYAELTRLTCERRRALFAVDCELVDTTEAREAVEALARGVSLAELWLGGVPASSDGRLLRAPGVLVLQHGVPVAGVPVIAAGLQGEGQEALRTDAEGRAAFDATSPALRVQIDAASMLGPLASVWPASTLGIEPRPVHAGRFSVVVVEGDEQEVGRALDRALQAHELPSAVQLRRPLARRLAGLAPGARGSALPRVADGLAGRVDVVAFVSVQSRFAGRAAGRRVWYEGTASADVHHAWTGRRLVRLEASGKESGVSETSAARAATDAAIEALTKRIVAHPDVPLPPEVERPADANTDQSDPVAHVKSSSAQR